MIPINNYPLATANLKNPDQPKRFEEVQAFIESGAPYCELWTSGTITPSRERELYARVFAAVGFKHKEYRLFVHGGKLYAQNYKAGEQNEI